MSPDAFKAMLDLLRIKGITDYIVHTSCIIDKIYLINPNYYIAKFIIELISRSEPITGLIQFSLLNITEMTTITQLSHGASIESSSLTGIYNKTPILKTLFTSFNTTHVQTQTQFRLHPIISGLLEVVLLKREELNSNTTTRNG